MIRAPRGTAARSMNTARIGRIVRTLRRRLDWRQRDLALRADVSQQTISVIETGRLRDVSFATLERVLSFLEAELDVVVRWRGGELDRLLDDAHAGVSGAAVTYLEERGWAVRVETTYAAGYALTRSMCSAFMRRPRACSLLRSRWISRPPRRRFGGMTRRCDSLLASRGSGTVGTRGPFADCLSCPSRRRRGGGSSAMQRSFIAPTRRVGVNSRLGFDLRSACSRASCSWPLPRWLVMSETWRAGDGSGSRARLELSTPERYASLSAHSNPWKSRRPQA